MADNTQKTAQSVAQTAPKRTVTIDVSQLPKGVDPTKLIEVLQRAQKSNDRAKLYNEARRKAQSELAKNHPDEYAKLLKKYNPNAD